ncbi:Hypothetical predicted protein [Xyrichtys novacula]|uniref:Uncharacterized protein n=1 Tax=Xyrichtys novacula TaxID=13765 RepID=A0AAV1H6A5_XYRNO|nr:Hypothetical predicted protein [Xyrichtys novacula]
MASFWEPDVQTEPAQLQTCDPLCVLSLAEAESSCFTRTPARPDKTSEAARTLHEHRDQTNPEAWPTLA